MKKFKKIMACLYLYAITIIIIFVFFEIVADEESMLLAFRASFLFVNFIISLSCGIVVLLRTMSYALYIINKD